MPSSERETRIERPALERGAPGRAHKLTPNTIELNRAQRARLGEAPRDAGLLKLMSEATRVKELRLAKDVLGAAGGDSVKAG